MRVERSAKRNERLRGGVVLVALFLATLQPLPTALHRGHAASAHRASSEPGAASVHAGRAARAASAPPTGVVLGSERQNAPLHDCDDCPLCKLGSGFVGALPPAAASVLPLRAAARHGAAPGDPATAAPSRSSHRPRAPPVLG